MSGAAEPSTNSMTFGGVVRLLLAVPAAYLVYMALMVGQTIGFAHYVSAKFTYVAWLFVLISSVFSIIAGAVVASGHPRQFLKYVVTIVPILSLLLDLVRGLASKDLGLNFAEELIGTVIGMAIAWRYLGRKSPS